MSSDRRRQYRVSPDSDELSVAVFRPGCEDVPGSVVDLSAGGMNLVFPHGVDPMYKIGEGLYIKMSSCFLQGPIVVPSQVHRRKETEDGQLYALVFLDWLGLLSRLPPELASMFNQRSSYRFEPPSDQTIEVRVDGLDSDVRIEGPLRDLSSHGLSFRAPLSAEETLAHAKAIEVSFVLPTRSEALDFHCQIRYRDLSGDQVCYGLFFDPERTERFEDKQAEVSCYLSACQKKTCTVEAP